MSYNYDAQLIDSVKVGQARIEGALLFGSDRLKRQYKRRVGTFIVSFFLAVLGATGCVIGGWVIGMLTRYQEQQEQRNQQWQQPSDEPGVQEEGDGGPNAPADPDALGVYRPGDPFGDPASIPPEHADSVAVTASSPALDVRSPDSAHPNSAVLTTPLSPATLLAPSPQEI